MLTTTPTTIPGSLRILRAMAALTKTEAIEAGDQPQAVTDALDDTIDALTSVLDVIDRHPAPPAAPLPQLRIDPSGTGYLDQHDHNLEPWRAEAARRRTPGTPAVTACACDLWPLTDLQATSEDGVTTHAYEACISGGKIIAQRTPGIGVAALDNVTGGAR